MTAGQRVYDWVLDCNTCRQMFVFATRQERGDCHEHDGHDVELFRQVRL